MKQSPQLQKIQENMKPGVLSLHGFLGNDRRSLIEILEDDAARVRRLGTDHKSIAERMRYFRDRGEEGLGEFITIDDHFEVRVETVRGKIPSPFGGPGLYAKTNTTVRNLEVKKEVTYTDVNIHLVRDHGFYEGKGSPFRTDPEKLVEVLEIPLEEQQLEIPR
jgi:hypothetical protein